jgi:hypothetical protein
MAREEDDARHRRDTPGHARGRRRAHRGAPGSRGSRARMHEHGPVRPHAAASCKCRSTTSTASSPGSMPG